MSFRSWLKRPIARKWAFWVSRKYYFHRLTILRQRYQGLTQKAFDRGYKQAEHDKQHTLTLSYQPLAPLDSANSIVLSRPLPITPAIIAQFNTDLEGTQRPTPDQCGLIYSQNRSTRVVAGAGSGKSTTLVLRVLMLHKYLGIPLNQITVFSFTTASCQEFREKIIKVFGHHGIPVTEDMTKALVRTFHSKIREWSQGVLAGGQFQFFEFLSNDGREKQSKDNDRHSALDTRLNTLQRDVLKEAYQQLYQDNDRFRSLIRSLHQYAMRQSIFAPKSNQDLVAWQIRAAAGRDEAYTRLVNEMFPLAVTSESPIPIKVTTDTQEYTFYANRHYPEWDLYVVFTPSSQTIWNRIRQGETWPDRVSPDDKMEFKSVGSQKCTILQRFGHVLTLSSDQEYLAFKERLERYQASLSAPEHVAPNVRYRVTGEPSAADLWEVFFQLGTFIENVGLEVVALTDAPLPVYLPQSDQWVLEALCLFWPYFDECLGQRQIMRFHHGFAYFSERHPGSYSGLSAPVQRSMSHILIDEFQDISPEIVQWIRGFLRYMRTQDASTSLMVVGDDDQSIYGWRGSDPQFITDFDTHFPSDQGSEKVSMSDNFRSHQEMVDAGETVLKDVIGRDRNKHGVCSLGAGGQVECISEKKDETVCEHLVTLWNAFHQLPDEEQQARLDKGDIFVLVLSRSNNALKKAREDLLQALGLKRKKEISDTIMSFMTFHSSKGLEADNCILLDDCQYNNQHPLKNFIYHSTGNFQQSYDEAQRDEAMRLAYVALTRAKYRCWWYGKPATGGAMERLQMHLQPNATSQQPSNVEVSA